MRVSSLQFLLSLCEKQILRYTGDWRVKINSLQNAVFPSGFTIKI
jgi:hypothetical protein